MYLKNLQTGLSFLSENKCDRFGYLKIFFDLCPSQFVCGAWQNTMKQLEIVVGSHNLLQYHSLLTSSIYHLQLWKFDKLSLNT